jgi:HSP20 family molecular chaperone IbpA
MSADMALKYVHILTSAASADRYVGLTSDLRARVRKHDAGEVPHTAKHRPWRRDLSRVLRRRKASRIREVPEDRFEASLREEPVVTPLDTHLSPIPRALKRHSPRPIFAATGRMPLRGSGEAKSLNQMRTLQQMPRAPLFSSPVLLGFEDIERLLEQVSKNADGYPPYNIERVAATADEPAHLLITLAVAGFGDNEIEVTVEDNELTVSGRQNDDDGRDYLHRGIAARQFQRKFVLADGMEVKGAELKDGLLSIDLVRPEPERKIKRIPIASSG